mmetsp:Transcript_3213/g.9761  ORF Transcript_3213/g.9761 Transcript_3213/m.9761 type:complete len:576 (-) Transcript_3213:69-1796(-)
MAPVLWLVVFVAALSTALPSFSTHAVLLRAGSTVGSKDGLAAESGVPEGNDAVDYLVDTLGRFRKFAELNSKELIAEHAESHTKLQHDADSSENAAVRLALSQSVTSDKETFKETKGIYDMMVTFSNSMSTLLKNVVKHAPACDDNICGEHATCTVTSTGAACICESGFVGNGHDCHAPYEFMPHALLVGSSTFRAADINVCIFASDRIAVVFRDVVGGEVSANSGHIVIGRVKESGMAALAPPEKFTIGEGVAFQPVVTGVGQDRVAIAWRDDLEKGACYMRGAVLGGTGIRGADTAITWGPKVNFCESQAHKMALVSLPQGRFAILFSGKSREPAESFGAAVLGSVGPKGEATVLGQFRFTDSAVCRLEVTPLTPTSFIVAARATKHVDELDPAQTVTQQEAMAVHGEMVDNELVFSPNPANIEPERGQIWSRDVSLIAPNTYAYAYQDGQEMEIKMAVLGVDPSTHLMKVLSRDKVIRKGFSPYVAMLPMPYAASDPHTLTFYEDTIGNTSMVNLCSWSQSEHTLSRCQDFPWLDERVESVSGVRLGTGKFLLAFATESGIPYYSVFGVAKK